MGRISLIVPFSVSLLSSDETSADSLLPASFRTSSDDIVASCHDPWGCIASELNLDRPRQIHSILWLAGRQRLPRALHYQIVVSREVLITERMDMHLVRTRREIFIKPLPRYLLEPMFWSTYLQCTDGCICSTAHDAQNKLLMCETRKHWRVAFGFLLSYVALIAHESDLIIAQQRHLVSSSITWGAWRVFAGDILAHADSSSITKVNVDERFYYGELSLSRLSKLYRLKQSRLSGDYLVQWRHHSPFFSDRFKWLATATVYIALVLAAMQVGLATTHLGANESFQVASSGFTVFAIIAPLAAVALFALESCYVGVMNARATVAYSRSRQRQRQRTNEQDPLS